MTSAATPVSRLLELDGITHEAGLSFVCELPSNVSGDTPETPAVSGAEVFEDGREQPRTLSLFPADRCEAVIADESIVRVRLSELELCRPRQCGACWLVVKLWRELELDRFLERGACSQS